jgi:4-amino-4-deoxy-L-arabinose transferase-like glycosyltransferase
VSLVIQSRPRSTLFSILLLWVVFYASFTLFSPPLLDDADSVHAEVAREMLLRHDYVTLYANGIRYLEKAPLFYWAVALSMKVSTLFGASSPIALAAAARIPLALSMFALTLLCEAFARRIFGARAGLYAALIVLSSFGIFLFTRMLIPDAIVCLWTTLAIYCLWRTEEQPEANNYIFCYGFATACALNVLTKGLIGVVFPVAIALIYLIATHGFRATLQRIRKLHPIASLAIFLLISAPWHILAGLANPSQGHPTPFTFVNGHWIVPLPTDGNVRGWFWFYFMNEHVLRYLNLRIPHDYDTAPLWLLWGLCFLWLMPWSALGFKAVWPTISQYFAALRVRLNAPVGLRRVYIPELRSPRLLLVIWTAFILLFFSLSSRQEYYVLPALPAVAILIAGWLALDSYNTTVPTTETQGKPSRAYIRCLIIPLILGLILFAASLIFLIDNPTPAPNTDLATLLTQNPSDYALSLGHFMDLTGPSVALFRFPLMIAACSLFFGPLIAIILRFRRKPHAANLTLATSSFGFLISVFLGLRIFSPVLTSAQLADVIALQLHPQDIIAIHGEYESGSTLGFYLQRNDIHILEGRSSNLWYGSYFPDAPHIFETPDSIAKKWSGPQRIFLWQFLTDPPNTLPSLPGPVYILVKNGGKEIVSNQPNR